MESTHLYLDEAGNFDFGPNGTRWLVLTCVKIPWDSQRIAHLAQLRHDLLLEGIGLEYFHASEDNRRVRQRFLGKIAPWLPPASVKARALLKQDINERLRAPERFYPAFVGPLVERHIGQSNERVWVFSDTLPLNKKRHGLEKAIAAELASRSTGQGTHTFLHHASKSNFDLQIADYCCWAIWRSLTKGDHQAMDILGQAVDLQE
jgi:hypothetical protein